MDQSRPTIDELIQLASDYEVQFKTVQERVEFDRRAMWYSELFSFVLMCEYTNCTRIIESGRARGVSTAILAEYFKDSDMEIISIDDRQDSKDARIAENRLADAENVTLEYGDSREIAPKLVVEGTCALIDGPKGDDALKLAVNLTNHDHVSFVAVHDLHKDHFYRELSELLFSDPLYTDADRLVQAFKTLDDEIHDWSQSTQLLGDTIGPYLKDGVDSDSYGHTLGFFFKPASDKVVANYLAYVDANRDLLRSIARELRTKRATGGAISRRMAAFILWLGQAVLR